MEESIDNFADMDVRASLVKLYDPYQNINPGTLDGFVSMNFGGGDANDNVIEASGDIQEAQRISRDIHDPR